MDPSSVRITRGEPFLAQATAHSALMGFFRSLVYAHAESSTHPVTVVWVPAAVALSAARTGKARSRISISLRVPGSARANNNRNRLSRRQLSRGFDDMARRNAVFLQQLFRGAAVRDPAYG